MEWVFVAEIDRKETTQLEKHIRDNQCIPNGVKGNNTYYRCDHQKKKTSACDYKMLLRREPGRPPILYFKGEHNHDNGLDTTNPEAEGWFIQSFFCVLIEI
jgi:hypothetical protein